MIPPNQFLKYIIRPVLKHLSKANPRLGGTVSEQLMLGTAIVESNLEDLVQKGSGPARSMFQIELATFSDVYNRYLATNNRDLLDLVNDWRFKGLGIGPLPQLCGNHYFACAVARARYWMVPEPLPLVDDINGMGQYWKTYYNTPSGKGKVEDFVRKLETHLDNLG